MIDRPGAVRYSDYNAYCNAETAWQLGGETRTLIDLQEIADAYSRESTPEFATVDEVSVLLNPGPFAAAGPLGRPIGIYRDEPDRREFRLLHGPTVYSVGATSANLEWMTSLPAVCEIAWGETPECTNVKKFEVNYFGSYGLTGLQPGRTYYFRVNSLKAPLVKNEDEQARPDPVEPSAPAISFTTLAENPRPTTYYVAPDGDDSAAGRDQRQAWRSLRHAATQVRPGDTVFVAGGTYQERVQLRVTGEPDAPITFRCMPGEKVVMDGAKQTIKGAFLATGKSHLRFDGFYFRDFNFLNRGWKLGLSAEFLLYDGRDIQITRCFSDGRTGMYTARFVIAERIEDLLIKNCVTIDKMSAQMVLTNCPNLHIEHTVFARPKTANLHLFNEEEHPAVIEKCIFTDMLKKKSDSNIPMFLIYQRSGFQMQNVCFMLRSFPPEERLLVPGLGDDRKRIKIKDVEREAAFMKEPLYANPRFAGDPSVPGEFAPDKMMPRDLPLDFDSFFATNPDAVARGIGLIPQDFEDFRFEKK